MPEAIPVGCVFMSKFRAGATMRPKPLTPGGACLELLQHTLSARTQPELVLPVLQAVANRARSYKGTRGEASKAAGAVLAMVEAS